MKILLLHDDIYVPSLGGGVKAQRCLVEQLARRGHDCQAISHALTGSPDGPNTPGEFHAEMNARSIAVEAVGPNVFRYRFRGVQVDALLDEQSEESRRQIQRHIEQFSPDWIVVTDDKRQSLLRMALAAAPRRVVMSLQTVTNLPFGPFSVRPSKTQAELMRQARAIIVTSVFFQEHIALHSGLRARLLPLPVFGNGPFPNLANFDSGHVTMINPCELKGLPVFLALAGALPDVAFAAVPTWGANPSVLRQLAEQPNIRVLQASDDIEDILRQTRVLLAPSLWPETFGMVVPEAMLRGIPVLASNVCGLPNAKLGVDYVLPVQPAEWRDGSWWCPPRQDVSAWAETLRKLLGDPREYERVSTESRSAAQRYVSHIDIGQFEDLLAELALQDRPAAKGACEARA